MSEDLTYIDSHAHLSGEALFSESESIIKRALVAGIEQIVNICTDVESLRKGLMLSEKYPEVVNVGCTTPHDVEKEGESAFSAFADAARSGHLKAIGETGLDYHYLHSAREIQKNFLKKYLALAIECDLPVVFHCREAFEDLFAITDEIYLGKPAVLHCFTGTADEANEVIRRGWMISFSGILTFKKSESLREIAKKAPLSQILIETDAPYLAPQSQRGKTNEPSFLPETAACLAAAKGISLSEVARATADNARQFFRLYK